MLSYCYHTTCVMQVEHQEGQWNLSNIFCWGPKMDQTEELNKHNSAPDSFYFIFYFFPKLWIFEHTKFCHFVWKLQTQLYLWPHNFWYKMKIKKRGLGHPRTWNDNSDDIKSIGKKTNLVIFIDFLKLHMDCKKKLSSYWMIKSHWPKYQWKPQGNRHLQKLETWSWAIQFWTCTPLQTPLHQN